MENKNIHLKNRKVLKISGANCIEFLNNILTSDISKLKPKEALPSALLSPQGRILFYMLVSSNNLNKSLNDKSVFVETSEGKTLEYCGERVTSSKVSASFIGSMIIYI